MSFYVDASILVAAVTAEARSHDARAWLRQAQPGAFAISAWGMTELASALAMKLRIGEVTMEGRVVALADADSMAQLLFEKLPFLSIFFDQAARLTDRYETGLRAGDALHLAICGYYGRTLATFDRGQAKAGPAAGVQTFLL